MQIYADVTGRSWRVAASSQTPALGSAMFGAVAAGPAAGGHATIEDAARAMARLRGETYEPIALEPAASTTSLTPSTSASTTCSGAAAIRR